ncbi:DUF11 domain-containing protein [Actinomadura darangshiensis]|uniref:DUF11 domain-containing protein n=1 Tax=Actinomadura darangshiensis TaxID=705336 RepID=A0A4R5B6W3_9ACTN|nr:DUF11 domain-containing protein [Actinomadura darangshiensis]TDD81621.1 DUF11 domain-containing protein [Actinomadura darangshiensis]
MIRTLKGRGLVLLTAAPLLGVVPMAAGASAAGPGAGEGHHGAASKPPPRPRAHAKPAHKPTKHKPKPTKHKPTKHKAHGEQAAAVTLRTTGPGKSVIPGRTYEWTFKVTAKGPKKSGKAVFRTTLPKSLAFVSGEKDCASEGRQVECDLGTLKKGGTAAGAIKAKVSRRAEPGAKVSVRGTVTWGKARATRRFPAVRVARTADLAISKAAPTTARAGAKIPYAMKVRNLGPSTAENVTVESAGPIKIVGRDTACIARGRGYVCSVGSLRKGESRTLHLKAEPSGNVRAGAVVRSSWTVVSPTTDLNEGNNRTTARTRITKRR